MLKVTKVRHNWPENKLFISRPDGGQPDYIFLLFHNAVHIRLEEEEILTKPGAMMVYDQPTPQYFYSDSLIYHDWIHIQGDLDNVMKECGLLYNTIYYPENTKQITEAVRMMETEFFAEKSHRETITDCTLRTMFYRISRDVRGEEQGAVKPGGTVTSFRVLRREMFATPEKNWTVAEMAASVCLSESRFYTLYRRIFGISPVRDLICARMDKARIYLESGRYTVKEVSVLLGYTNVFHFIKQFKQHTGTTPGQYRS